MFKNEQMEHNYSAEDLDNLVFKLGRTTGVTTGRLAGAEPLVREYHCCHCQPSGQKKLESEPTEVIGPAIVPVGGTTTATATAGSGGLFARDGDSGAVGARHVQQPRRLGV